MKVLVPVKRVVDHNVRVRLNEAASGVEIANLKMSMNPFDENAVEAAVRLKEQGKAEEVVIVSIGPAGAAQIIRTALAMGGTRGILVKTEEKIEPLAAAKILKRICETEQPDLVICGRQAIDDDAAQVGPMLAGLLGWGQAVGASSLTLEDGAAEVRCETDSGSKTILVKLPAVVTADLRLNEPRYATLPNMMKAKKKPLEEKPAADFGVDTAPRLKVLSLREPTPRQAGVMVASVREFLEKLHQAGALK